ncbi:MAG TPA: efflux RND transporter periplasmic adaptor subunit [Steroidobacter sp.]
MNTSYKVVAVVVIVALLAAAGGYWFARRETHDQHAAQPEERKVLYWYDPMHPDQHFDKPGKSPFMDMDLVPKYADEEDRAPGIKIDPGVAQSFGVRLTRVERASIAQTFEAVGTIGFNLRDVAVVQARAAGFVARVYARAPGDVIARGAPLVDLTVPEWAAAQAEFLALLASGDRTLVDAARERMRLLGMPEALVQAVESQRRARAEITIRAPLAGMIETLDARAGMTVEPGTTLAKINGLDPVWIDAAVPEARGSLAVLGQAVRARLTAYPGETFDGKVVTVLPQADADTRTLRVRIELPNGNGRLRPGMFAQVYFEDATPQPALYVASEAVIRTGVRDVVIVAEAGRFIPTQVQVGPEVNGKTAILQGLSEGQQVVASGQFLIDSEANLRGALARLASGAPDEPTSEHGDHSEHADHGDGSGHDDHVDHSDHAHAEHGAQP